MGSWVRILPGARIGKSRLLNDRFRQCCERPPLAATVSSRSISTAVLRRDRRVVQQPLSPSMVNRWSRPSLDIRSARKRTFGMTGLQGTPTVVLVCALEWAACSGTEPTGLSRAWIERHFRGDRRLTRGRDDLGRRKPSTSAGPGRRGPVRGSVNLCRQDSGACARMTLTQPM